VSPIVSGGSGGGGGASSVRTKYGTAGGTWSPASASNLVEVICVGSGGGGGGGIYVAGGTISGGAGGGGGAVARALFRVADITPPITVTVGAGGAGGAGVRIIRIGIHARTTPPTVIPRS